MKQISIVLPKYSNCVYCSFAISVDRVDAHKTVFSQEPLIILQPIFIIMRLMITAFRLQKNPAIHTTSFGCWLFATSFWKCKNIHFKQKYAVSANREYEFLTKVFRVKSHGSFLVLGLQISEIAHNLLLCDRIVLSKYKPSCLPSNTLIPYVLLMRTRKIDGEY